ncbi:MAG: citrate/2-methylcitrate synthase [Candidatus Bathyarchaeia archaeon]
MIERMASQQVQPTAPPATKDTGLRGVFVADTTISLIDGIRGELSYRGYDIHDLASNSSDEEVAYLLLYGSLPTGKQLNEFSQTLKAQRKLPESITELLKRLPRSSSSISVLQATVALLAEFDSDKQNDSKDSNLRRAALLISTLPTLVAFWDRIRRGLSPIEPDAKLSRAANFLYMLTGIAPDDEIAKDFDTCLVLHAEHTLNASTFTARVVASTRAHMYAAVSAAVGSLSGELHGGANMRVMQNLEEIGDPAKVEGWVKSKLDNHMRIMGMGHAVYKALDPRADLLRQIAEKLARKTGEPKWYLITREIERVTQSEFRKRKNVDIYPNVDLYSASVYHMMGIPDDLFTPIFAISRVSGWSAHIIEEKFPKPPIKPELYRPKAQYQGNYCGPVGCKYVPLSKRGTVLEPLAINTKT